jgi:NAD(P)-dependent dehydrogenase (short-subunit alcohol dehydrogenase family)
MLIFLTGASSGLGAAIAAHASTLGHQVLGFCRRMPAPPIIPMPMDLERFDEVPSLTSQAMDRYGVPAMVFCCAARGSAGYGRSAFEVPRKTLLPILYSNLVGHLLFGHTCAQAMAACPQPPHVIVFISSLGAHIPFTDLSAYCISKAGIEMGAKQLRELFAQTGPRVILARPGQMPTPFFDAAGLTSADLQHPRSPATVAKALFEVAHTEVTDITVGVSDAQLMRSSFDTTVLRVE